ncbi:MAG TPA: hypothetical protein DCQ08_00445 [Amoebophilaceae bacterium]|nr:hypothetical protein [Amoebophilaceae bacterium]
MIQRPQSIFLLMVISALLAVVLISAACVRAVGAAGIPFGRIFLPWLFAGLLSLIATGIAMYALLRYDRRRLQLRLGILNAYVLVILLGLSLYLSTQRQKETQLLMSCLLLAIALASNLLANRCIRKDEKLVKFSERMR